MGVRRRKADKQEEEQSWLLGNSCAGFFFLLFFWEGRWLNSGGCGISRVAVIAVAQGVT